MTIHNHPCWYVLVMMVGLTHIPSHAILSVAFSGVVLTQGSYKLRDNTAQTTKDFSAMALKLPEYVRCKVRGKSVLQMTSSYFDKDAYLYNAYHLALSDGEGSATSRPGGHSSIAD